MLFIRKINNYKIYYTMSSIVLLQKKQSFIYACLLSMTFTISAHSQSPEKPVLTKLPFAYPKEGRVLLENTPVIFDSQLLIVANSWQDGVNPQWNEAYIYIEDLQNGCEVARFGKGHFYASAYVNGKELNVFASDFTDYGKDRKSVGIDRLVTNDLKNWKTEKVILPEGGEHLYNTSVCADDKGFIMAYESNNPVSFCIKFARSADLSKWEKIAGVTYSGEKMEYSACPVIRYFAPYYYIIYLHAPIAGHNGWISYMARSNNLEGWELSPYNPILEAGAGEGINNSDVDILEYEGKTYLYYLTGNQQSWATMRIAMYDGKEKAFFENHFPKNHPLIQVSAKQ